MRNKNLLISASIILSACTDPYFKNNYEDNSPTSGKLKVYYDEGLNRHIKNHVYTFEALYPSATVTAFSVSEGEAIKALYDDSCKAIVIQRFLSPQEQQSFSGKNITINYSAIAKTGVALVSNTLTALDSLSYDQVVLLLTQNFNVRSSSGEETKITVLLDKNNSSVIHYLKDSLLGEKKFSANCNVLNSSIEAINHVAKHPNSIALIDFAWLSDVDDSIYKANQPFIRLIPVSRGRAAEFPNQSSFKLGTYPLTRTIHYIRRSGEFSLGKGFESFMAGPAGQNTFLKQGLLPLRQQERNIKINLEPAKTE